MIASFVDLLGYATLKNLNFQEVAPFYILRQGLSEIGARFVGFFWHS